MAELGAVREEVTFVCEGAGGRLQVRSVHGVESLGEPFVFEVGLFADQTVKAEGVLGQPCRLELRTAHGQRCWHGVVMCFTAMATAAVSNAPSKSGRHYRLEMCGSWAVLSLGRQRHVYQRLSAPDIIAQVFEAAGLDAPQFELSDEHGAYEQLTQLDESDGRLVRRMLEQDGMWLRYEAPDEDEDSGAWTLCDAVQRAPDGGALRRVDGSGMTVDEPCAWHVTMKRRRALGCVSLGGHNAAQPTHRLLGQARAGTAGEQAIERYHHRSGSVGAAVKTDAAAELAAQRLLQASRAASSTVGLSTNVPVGVGCRVQLTADGAVKALFVTQLSVQWSAGAAAVLRVNAIDADGDFALPPLTPKPIIHGGSLAMVAGPSGQETHCDALGRVRLRFVWDRFGPVDSGPSSLAVRVAQPQLGGSLLLPRVGWEVVVAFEDGDPDRPYVLGRLDNGAHRPAAALPANKTMTRLATFSSPAGKGYGAGQNAIVFEDGAGRQGLGFIAAKDMCLTAAGDMLTQVGNVDALKVGADRSLAVGGFQTISVATGALVYSSASQFIAVGGSQSFKTPAAMALSTGSVTVSAASLSEQVGSSGGGLGDLAKTAAFSAMGAAGGAKGMALSAMASAAVAYQDGGAEGAAAALLKTGAGALPGVGTVVEVAEAHGQTPWQPQAQDSGGGAEDASAAVGGAQDAAGVSHGGSGKRITVVSANMTEAIGGAYLVNTPGSSSWTALGLSTLMVGANHGVVAGMYSVQVLGAASVTAPAITIRSAGSVLRSGRLMKMTVAGALALKSGADAVIKAAGTLSLSAAALKLQAATVVLVCGAAKVTIGAGTIVAEAPVVTFEASTKAAEAVR